MFTAQRAIWYQECHLSARYNIFSFFSSHSQLTNYCRFIEWSLFSRSTQHDLVQYKWESKGNTSLSKTRTWVCLCGGKAVCPCWLGFQRCWKSSKFFQFTPWNFIDFFSLSFHWISCRSARWSVHARSPFSFLDRPFQRTWNEKYPQSAQGLAWIFWSRRKALHLWWIGQRYNRFIAFMNSIGSCYMVNYMNKYHLCSALEILLYLSDFW